MRLSVHSARSRACRPTLPTRLASLWTVASGLGGILCILLGLLSQRHAPAVVQLLIMNSMMLLGGRTRGRRRGGRDVGGLQIVAVRIEAEATAFVVVAGGVVRECR